MGLVDEVFVKPTYENLKSCYEAVKKLTLHHDVWKESAVVFPSKLGIELEKVDPQWWQENKVPQWRLVCEWLQEIVNLHPEQLIDCHQLARDIKLAHYEEIYYGEKNVTP